KAQFVNGTGPRTGERGIVLAGPRTNDTNHPFGREFAFLVIQRPDRADDGVELRQRPGPVGYRREHQHAAVEYRGDATFPTTERRLEHGRGFGGGEIAAGQGPDFAATGKLRLEVGFGRSV